MEDTDNISMPDLASVYMENNIEHESDSLLHALPCKSEYVQPGEITDITRHNESLLSCFHVNCRGLVCNWSSFNDLLNSTDHHFDFIGVSECFNIHNDPRIKIQ